MKVIDWGKNIKLGGQTKMQGVKTKHDAGGLQNEII